MFCEQTNSGGATGAPTAGITGSETVRTGGAVDTGEDNEMISLVTAMLVLFVVIWSAVGLARSIGRRSAN
jgi:hypothetical protein